MTALVTRGQLWRREKAIRQLRAAVTRLLDQVAPDGQPSPAQRAAIALGQTALRDTEPKGARDA